MFPSLALCSGDRASLLLKAAHSSLGPFILRSFIDYFLALHSPVSLTQLCETEACVLVRINSCYCHDETLHVMKFYSDIFPIPKLSQSSCVISSCLQDIALLIASAAVGSLLPTPPLHHHLVHSYFLDKSIVKTQTPASTLDRI